MVLALTLALGNGSQAADFVSVRNNDVNLRSGPDTKQTVLYTLPRGTPLRSSRKRGHCTRYKMWMGTGDGFTKRSPVTKKQ